jgi:hypothetical protein
MPFAKIEPSGCEIWHKGLVKVRLDFFLTPDDVRYDERYILVPVFPETGIPKDFLDKDGNIKDQKKFDAWVESLPRIYQLNPFHSHLLRFKPEELETPDILEAAINHHIPNFYAAWCQECDKLKGGMRKGWDVETRPKTIGRPRRYDKEFTAEELEPLRLECQSKLDLVLKSDLAIQSDKLGEIFPSTEIDVGPGAEGRSGTLGAGVTNLSDTNPANDEGSIDTWETWFQANGTGVKVGTFYGTPNNFTPRDYETWGNVASGSKQSLTSADTDISIDDICGIYQATGNIEAAYDFGSNRYSKTGDQFDAGQQTYTLSYYVFSLYGTGETAGGVDYPIEFSTGLTLSPSVAASQGRTISLSKGITLAPTIAPKVNWNNIFSKGLTLAATILAKTGVGASFSTGITLSPTFAVPKIAWHGTFSKGVILSPAISQTIAWHQAFTKGINLAASIVAVLGKIVSFTTGVVLSATIQTVIAWHASFSKGVTLSPTISKVLGMRISFSKGITLSPTIVKSFGYKVAFSVGVTLQATVSIVGRCLKLVVLTAQDKLVRAFTAQDKDVKVATSQDKKIDVITSGE